MLIFMYCMIFDLVWIFCDLFLWIYVILLLIEILFIYIPPIDYLLLHVFCLSKIKKKKTRLLYSIRMDFGLD